MRITFVLPGVNLSGGEKVVAIYAAALAARGHKVAVVLPPNPDLALKDKLKSVFRGNGWPKRQTLSESHLKDLDRNIRVLDRRRPPLDRDIPDSDVVIATWWETAEWVRALSPSKGAKVYFIQHHEVFSYLPVLRCHATYRLPMHKIVVARWLEEVMRDKYGDAVVDVVPNSVDQTQFFAAARGKQPVPTIGFLYSTATFKGLDLTLAVLADLKRRIPNLRAVCFGSERPTPALPVPAYAEFFHRPPQDQIRNLYASCDVWITSSRTEGFNLPAIEAMACRTPIVATKAGWPWEAVETGRNGVLVEVDDMAGLTQGAEWILRLEDSDWRRLSSNAYRTATSGSWHQSADKFEKALIRACARSARDEISGKCLNANEHTSH